MNPPGLCTLTTTNFKVWHGKVKSKLLASGSNMCKLLCEVYGEYTPSRDVLRQDTSFMIISILQIWRK